MLVRKEQWPEGVPCQREGRGLLGSWSEKAALLILNVASQSRLSVSGSSA